MVRAALMALAAAFGAALAFGYAGAWHGLGDSLAVFRLPLAAGFALVVIWADWPRRVRWPLAALALLVMAQIVALRFETGVPGPLVVYQKNLNYRNADVLAVAEDILRRAPDLIALQEVSDRTRPILEALAQAYPHRHVCSFSGVGSTAILSRHALSNLQCPAVRGVALAQVRYAGGDLWFGSVHLHWPWPYGQREQVRAISDALEALEGPVVVAGDFNAVPWSWAVRAVADASGTVRAGALAPTLWKASVPLPIDHVLAPGGGTVEVLDRLGSDHNGLLARVSLAAPGNGQP